MDTDDLGFPHVPVEVARYVYQGWDDMAHMSCRNSETQEDVRTFPVRLLGQVVAEPEETTFAVLELGFPQWEHHGWGADTFLDVYLQQTRALSVLERKAVAERQANRENPQCMRRWHSGTSSVATDFAFKVLLTPHTVFYHPGRHGLYGETEWEDTERPFKVGDTLVLDAKMRCRGPHALRIDVDCLVQLHPDAAE